MKKRKEEKRKHKIKKHYTRDGGCFFALLFGNGIYDISNLRKGMYIASILFIFTQNFVVVLFMRKTY